MGLTRRQSTKEFKMAAVRRLDQGVSIGEACIAGSLLVWAFHEQGAAERWVARDLDALLQPYLA